MRYTGAILASCCAVVLVASSFTATAAPPAAGKPTIWATWITRDIEIDLQDLPKLYTCNDLWYKLHGVLLAIGAREYMDIKPYQCGAQASGGGRSPRIDVRFQTLRELTGADIRWAQTSAKRKTVRLGPGQPKILDSSDCALLSQLNGTLFSYLGTHVVETDLQCSSPEAGHNFSLAVDTLIAVPVTSSHTRA